jgi:predicted nucleotidyltransferase
MRTAPPRLLPIFRSESQVRLLALLLLQPERRWTREELTVAVGAPASSVHRELRRAEAAGLVVRDTASRPHVLRAGQDSPLVQPLTTLLERTVGVEASLRELFERRDDVEAAAIHGSWAAGRAGPHSDIDVIAVGSAPAKALRPALRQIGRSAGRELDLSVYARDEYVRKTADENGFLRLMLERPLVRLKGDLRELAS